jgi:hypothetical protein
VILENKGDTRTYKAAAEPYLVNPSLQILIIRAECNISKAAVPIRNRLLIDDNNVMLVDKLGVLEALRVRTLYILGNSQRGIRSEPRYVDLSRKLLYRLRLT